jgi:hypothetical protein
MIAFVPTISWLHLCTVPTVWYFFDYIYALFRRCGIFWLHLCTVPTVWYFLITFMHCSDGVVFFDYIYTLFRRCSIFFITFMHCSDGVVFFLLHLCTVPTVWYFFITFMHCSDGVVFFVFHFFRPQYQTHSYTLGLHAWEKWKVFHHIQEPISTIKY